MCISHHYWVEHPVVDDGVDSHRDRVPGENLLGRDVKADRPQINLLVVINAGEDKKYPRAFGSSSSQPSKTKNNGSLILLYNLLLNNVVVASTVTYIMLLLTKNYLTVIEIIVWQYSSMAVC